MPDDVKNFSIVLDNQPKNYFPGQQVTGRLILDLERERKTKGITVNFYGRAHASWTETYTVSVGHGKDRHSETRTRRLWGRESYFDYKVNVVGGSGSEVILPPGVHQFRISFQLPMGIPSSFGANLGGCGYYVSATLQKSWGSDTTTETSFEVIGIYDLNTIQDANLPVEFRKEKYKGCCCCKDGPISFVCKLNKKGFIVGETLGIVIEMNNQSRKPLPQITVKLMQLVSFYAEGKKRSYTVTLGTFVGPGVGAHSTELWRLPPDATIPEVPITDLGGCRVINVGYSIDVVMKIPCGINLKGSTDIVVGNIPFRNNFAQTQPHSGHPSASPSAQQFGVA